MSSNTTWKSCTSCKKSIDFGATYWECSVSTCNRKKLGLFFCTVACWDAHLPEARHREAWAIEKTALTESEWDASGRAAESGVVTQAISEKTTRRTVAPAPIPAVAEDLPKEVLIVVSKLKKYIKAKSDMKTSETVIPVLSEEIRKLCDRAIRVAGKNGRKTVMDRDVREAIQE